jgi:hypothetical protein
MVTCVVCPAARSARKAQVRLGNEARNLLDQPAGAFYEALRKDFLGGYAHAVADKVGVVLDAYQPAAEVNVLREQERVPLFFEWYEADGQRRLKGRVQLPRNGQQYKATSSKTILGTNVRSVGVLQKQGEPCLDFAAANPLLARKVRSGNSAPCGAAVRPADCICYALAKKGHNGNVLEKRKRVNGALSAPNQRLEVMRVRLDTEQGKQFALAVKDLVAPPPPFHAFIRNVFHKTDLYLKRVLAVTPDPDIWLKKWAAAYLPLIPVLPPRPNNIFHQHFEQILRNPPQPFVVPADMVAGGKIADHDAITLHELEFGQNVFRVRITDPAQQPPKYKLFHVADPGPPNEELAESVAWRGFRQYVEGEREPVEPNSRHRLVVADIAYVTLRQQ